MKGWQVFIRRFIVMAASKNPAPKRKTLKELRALAHTRGLRRYSRLSRVELEKLLSGHEKAAPSVEKKPGKAKPATSPERTETITAQTRSESSPARRQRVASPARTGRARPSFTPVPVQTPRWEWITDIRPESAIEEQVEKAKYATVLPGTAVPHPAATDLGENIDQLPPVTEPTLCLLPQKPGVLHGYWILPEGSVPYPPSLRLRLGRIAGNNFEVINEIALPEINGRWYFHLNETSDTGAVYLQLGYYEPDGRFITATRRGIARIPSLYASGRTDRLWWVSEEQFRAMYLRAGGFVRGPRLGWAASLGSPSGAPGAPSPDRLAWPGNVSSQ